jgi:acetylornithine deacetylase
MGNCLIQPNRLKNLLKNLIDIYSPSGKEEQILEFLCAYLKKEGIRVHCQELDENRYNLLVLPPGKEEPEIVFLGHVDTVYAYDLEDFGYNQKDDRISGLGSADMKGGCAAMIESFVATAHLLNHEIPVALVLVVGEEEEGDGTARLLEDYRFPWAIIGEPTGMIPCFSHYGYMEIQLITSGKRKHASFANKNENAIEVLLNGFIKLSRHMGKEHPELVYNIRDIYSNRAGFAVAEQCEAWLDIHMPPSSPVGEIATELEEIFRKYCEKHSRIDCLFKIFTIDSGYELPSRGTAIDMLKRIYAKKHIPWTTDTFRSHSDANQLWAAGIKPVLLGPGRLEMAHTPDEYTSFREVCKAAEIYTALILEFADGLGKSEKMLEKKKIIS